MRANRSLHPLNLTAAALLTTSIPANTHLTEASMHSRNSRRTHSSIGIAATCFALLLSSLATSTRAQAPAPSNPASQAPAAKPLQHLLPPMTSAASESPAGIANGIKVHGHWIIDVKNPDGTIAEHRDFENSLVGNNQMVELLAGALVVSDYMVFFTGTTPPCAPTTQGYCALTRTSAVYPAAALCVNNYYYCVTGLTINYTYGQFPSMVLAGQMTATQAGSINLVGTYMGTCSNGTANVATTAPSTCQTDPASGYGYAAFTQTGLTQLNVLSGQIVQVTVTITFS
ncbi:MAG: hypothetical protein V4555_16065 [Acidobacteriota bacterium]